MLLKRDSLSIHPCVPCTLMTKIERKKTVVKCFNLMYRVSIAIVLSPAILGQRSRSPDHHVHVSLCVLFGIITQKWNNVESLVLV